MSPRGKDHGAACCSSASVDKGGRERESGGRGEGYRREGSTAELRERGRVGERGAPCDEGEREPRPMMRRREQG